jgi:DNA-binding transcriptional regulator YbjK
MNVPRRKPNSEVRRRELCDAAIELLAADGARGLTHLRVDRHAGFADGTTSFYYQTRSALLRSAIDRVIELDLADFTEALDAAREGEVDSLLSTVAPLLGLQAMAAATSRIRIATAVLNQDLRHPRVEHRHRGEADGRRGCVGVRR